MAQWGKYLIFVGTGLIFYLLSFYFNDWLSSTMQRHQLIQLPAMLIMGMGVSYLFPQMEIKNTSLGISVLIFFMASLTFWMIPHSIDKSVIFPYFNRIMHLNMILIGFLIVPVLHHILFEIKIAFLGMLSVSIMVSGIALRTFNILLCSSFDIFQQKQTGLLLLGISVCLLFYTYRTLFKGIGKDARIQVES